MGRDCPIETRLSVILPYLVTLDLTYRSQYADQNLAPPVPPSRALKVIGTDDADDQLFERVNRNSNHVLELYLPAKRECCYSLRSQSHERTLINKTTELSERDYIVRVLYKYSY